MPEQGGEKLVDKVNGGTIKVGDYISYTPNGASTEDILQELATYSGNTDSTKNTASTLTQEIDKETGLFLQTTETEIITERDYEFYNVKDSIFIEPDISQYTLK